MHADVDTAACGVADRVPSGDWDPIATVGERARVPVSTSGAVYLMFRRRTAAAVALAQVLAREPLVCRVERWADDTNVVVEVLVLNQQQLDDFVERFEPDEVHEVVSRVERARVALKYLGTISAQS
jgi:hypothetical protein